jgi:hypothetical protein
MLEEYIFRKNNLNVGSNMHIGKVLLKTFLTPFVVVALLILLPVFTLMIWPANEITQSDSISTTQDAINIANAEAALKGMFSHRDSGLDIDAGVTDTAMLLSTNTRTPIMGESVLTAEQLTAFLLSRNPNPRINSTALELAQYFIAEGEKEGVRGDIAFFQAIHETGWFRFGGQVLPEQNNFAGIGAVNHSPVGAGAWFDTPEIGVRAQIHHLKAYATTEPFVQSNASPRYRFVTRGIAPTWEDLNGRWAVPGTTYAQRILRLYAAALEFATREAQSQIT